MNYCSIKPVSLPAPLSLPCQEKKNESDEEKKEKEDDGQGHCQGIHGVCLCVGNRGQLGVTGSSLWDVVSTDVLH